MGQGVKRRREMKLGMVLDAQRGKGEERSGRMVSRPFLKGEARGYEGIE